MGYWTGENIEHEECGSSDALQLYEEEDGRITGFCFSCDTYVENPLNEERKSVPQTNDRKYLNNNWPLLSMQEIKKLPDRPLRDRGISTDTAKLYGVKVQLAEDGSDLVYYFPYRKKGKVSGYKVRRVGVEDKKHRYHTVGDIKNAEMFGQHLCGDGGRLIIVTEGEVDALSAFQLVWERRGKPYRVVSLRSGDSSIRDHLDWLERFDSVKLCYDPDESGKRKVEKAAGLFSPGKATVMELPDDTDVNDMLLADQGKQFYAAIGNAKGIHVDGVVSGDTTWELVKHREPVIALPYPDGWEELNEKTYGLQLGALDTWTSGSGSGKTQLLRQLQYHILNNSQSNVGVLALEEPLVDSVESLMGLHLHKRIHLPDVRETVTEEELYNAWLATAGTGRIHYYDHFGSLDDDSLISKIRYMARGLKCEYIFLDHLSILVSEFAAQGGERERIDTAMSRLKKLTQELKVWIGLVVHLRKHTDSGPSFEEGAIPTLDDLRGSGSIKQLSNGVFSISRNQLHPDYTTRNTSQVTVLKCRLTGETGPAGFLYYDRDTGHMIPTENPYMTDEEIESETG